MYRYDQVAELLGVAIGPFKGKYKDESMSMKGLLLRYLQAARVMVQQQASCGAGGVGQSTGVGLSLNTGVGVASNTGVGIPSNTSVGIGSNTGIGVALNTGVGVTLNSSVGVDLNTGMGITSNTGVGVGVNTGIGITSNTSVGVGLNTGIGVASNTGVGFGVIPGQAKVTLTYSAYGFPVLPRPLSTAGMKKEDWERLYMDYMSCHYSESSFYDWVFA